MQDGDKAAHDRPHRTPEQRAVFIVSIHKDAPDVPNGEPTDWRGSVEEVPAAGHEPPPKRRFRSLLDLLDVLLRMLTSTQPATPENDRSRR